MASQPIYGDNGEVVDQYNDGEQPEDREGSEEQEGQPPAQIEAEIEREEHHTDPSHVPSSEAIPVASAEVTPHAWTVPEMLQGPKDLFIGMTVHHDDGNEHGPLVSLFVREVPDGEVTVRTYRADALSIHAFLDNLQVAIAVTMQAHFLAWAQRQRKKLEEEEKRRSRQSQPAAKPSAAVGTTVEPTTAAPATASTQTQKPATTEARSKAATTQSPKYTTNSMFD